MREEPLPDTSRNQLQAPHRNLGFRSGEPLPYAEAPPDKRASLDALLHVHAIAGQPSHFVGK
jgi:hypothetical protein